MAGSETNSAIAPEVIADAQLIAECVASGKPIPPEVTRRVRDQSEQITARLRAQYGVVEIAVPALREWRGELPEP